MKLYRGLKKLTVPVSGLDFPQISQIVRAHCLLKLIDHVVNLEQTAIISPHSASISIILSFYDNSIITEIYERTAMTYTYDFSLILLFTPLFS